MREYGCTCHALQMREAVAKDVRAIRQVEEREGREGVRQLADKFLRKDANLRRQDQILNYLASHGASRLSDMAEAFGMSVSGLGHQLKKLYEDGKVRREGAGPQTRWSYVHTNDPYMPAQATAAPSAPERPAPPQIQSAPAPIPSPARPIDVENSDRKAVYEYVRTHPYCQARVAAAALHLQMSSVSHQLLQLKKAGRIALEGTRRSAVWVVAQYKPPQANGRPELKFECKTCHARFITV